MNKYGIIEYPIIRIEYKDNRLILDTYLKHSNNTYISISEKYKIINRSIFNTFEKPIYLANVGTFPNNIIHYIDIEDLNISLNLFKDYIKRVKENIIDVNEESLLQEGYTIINIKQLKI